MNNRGILLKINKGRIQFTLLNYNKYFCGVLVFASCTGARYQRTERIAYFKTVETSTRQDLTGRVLLRFRMSRSEADLVCAWAKSLLGLRYLYLFTILSRDLGGS